MEDFLDKVEEYLQNLVIEDFLTNSNERPAKREQIILDLTKISDQALIVDIPKASDIRPYISNIESNTSVIHTSVIGDFNQEKNHEEKLDVELTNIFTREHITDISPSSLEIPADVNKTFNIDGDTILLIVSVGRTGSTTLVNLFNSIPKTNICGENFNAVLKLLHCYYELREIKNAIPTSNNYNTFNLGFVTYHIRNLIINLFKNNSSTNLWGFKEVRWIENVKMLSVFRDLFPNVKIIFNVRKDKESQSNSAFWKNMPEALKVINEQNEIIKGYLDDNGFNYKTLYLEDFYDVNIMSSIYDFIGRADYFNFAQITLQLDFIKNTYKRQPFLHIHTFYKAKYKFIHIPKTGGSAIELFIRGYSEHIIGFGHDNLCSLNEFPVVVVRYPVDRFVSMFYYWKYGSLTPPFIRDELWLKKYNSFTIKDFIMLFKTSSYKILYSGFTWDQHFMPSSTWLDKGSYSRAIVILYENNLEDKVYKMMKYLDIDGGFIKEPVRKINVSRKDTEAKLDSEDIKWISNNYKADFDLWDNLQKRPELFRKII